NDHSVIRTFFVIADSSQNGKAEMISMPVNIFAQAVVAVKGVCHIKGKYFRNSYFRHSTVWHYDISQPLLNLLKSCLKKPQVFRFVNHFQSFDFFSSVENH